LVGWLVWFGLTTLFTRIGHTALNGRMILNDELESLWSWSGGIKENHEEPQDSLSLGWKLILEPPKYGVVTTSS
jgi:hypothetical protein